MNKLVMAKSRSKSQIVQPETELTVVATDIPNTNKKPTQVRLVGPLNTWTADNRRQIRLNPQQIAMIYDNVASNLSDQIDLANTIEDDDDFISSSVSLRREAVLGMDVEITNSATDAASTAATEYVRELMESTLFQEIEDHLLKAYLPGYASVGLVYEQQGNIYRPVDYYPLTANHFGLDSDLNLVFYTQPVGYGEFIYPDELNFITHTFATNKAEPGRYSIVRQLGKLWVMSRIAFSNWTQFLETWQLPILHIQYQEGTNTNALAQEMENFRDYLADKMIATPEGASVNAIETNKGNDPYITFCKWYEDRIAKKVLGQAVSQNGLQPNSQAGANAASDVREDIRWSDARLIDRTLQSYIDAFCEINFPNATPPKIRHFIAGESEVSSVNIQAMQFAIDNKLPVDLEQLYQKLGVDKPESLQQKLTTELNNSATGVTTPDQQAQAALQKQVNVLSAKLGRILKDKGTIN